MGVGGCGLGGPGGGGGCGGGWRGAGTAVARAGINKWTLTKAWRGSLSVSAHNSGIIGLMGSGCVGTRSSCRRWLAASSRADSIS